MKSQYNIDNIELNSHARSMLTRMGIYDIRDLKKWRKHTFSRTKGIGPRILHEVDNIMHTYGLKWREPISLSREEMIKDIKDVLSYKNGSYYVGSMACAHVYGALGRCYGREDIDPGIDSANIDKLKEIYEYLQSYIDFMKENPVAVCPCCHSIVSKQQINTNNFFIRFHENYVKLLVKQIGLKKAKKRLIEEGKVALEIEINQRLGE